MYDQDTDGPRDPRAPSTPQTDPWTAEDLQNATAFFTPRLADVQHTAQGQGQGWTVNDLISLYRQRRGEGLDHQAALDTVMGGFNTPLGAPPPTPPPTGGPPPPPATGGGPGGGPLPGAPIFTPPAYTPPPAFQAPPKFSYANFVAPDPNDLNTDPTYQYDLKTQQQAIQHSAAARGVLNTGGTIYDLLSNAHDLASTGYHDLWNRKMGEYQTNRGNAFDTYKTNYGIGKDVYDTNYGTQYTDPYKYGYQGAQDTYNARQHNFDLGTQYSWYGKLFDFQKDQDAFDRKYKLLSYA